MKLFYSPASPYARKIMVLTRELGLLDRVEIVTMATSPVAGEPSLRAANPLTKIPTLVTDEGQSVYDSRVIAEYLCGLAGDTRFFPVSGPARFRALIDQALGDGMLDAALLARYEGFLRPEALRWPEWLAGQIAKIDNGLDIVEAQAAEYGDRYDIGTLAIACAIGYLEFRFKDTDWFGKRPNLAAWYKRFNERPAMVATRPA